jgi:hypothetical protein
MCAPDEKRSGLLRRVFIFYYFCMPLSFYGFNFYILFQRTELQEDGAIPAFTARIFIKS